MDLRQTSQYGKYLKTLGWMIEEKDGVYYFIKRLPLIGSVIKIQRPKNIDLDFIDSLAKKHKAFQIILEPKDVKFSIVSDVQHKFILEHKYKLAKSSYLPTKTTVINLKNSDQTLLKNMHYKTRYNIKKSQKLKLKVQNLIDIKTFADFWQSCALKQRGMYISQKKEIIALYNAFKNRCSIIFVFNSATNPLAAVFSVYTKDTAFYMYAAATSEGKKLFAPTMAAWESIKLAKKSGLKFYDFEGVFDERFPLPSWKGFSRFKLSFGGKIIEYPGSYVKLTLPI